MHGITEGAGSSGAEGTYTSCSCRGTLRLLIDSHTKGFQMLIKGVHHDAMNRGNRGKYSDKQLSSSARDSAEERVNARSYKDAGIKQ